MEILLNLDNIVPARISNQSLKHLVLSLDIPEAATCATQELDGEIIFWDCGIEAARRARNKAGRESLMPEIGIKYQVDSQYTDFDYPELAYDWETAVIDVPSLIGGNHT